MKLLHLVLSALSAVGAAGAMGAAAVVHGAASSSPSPPSPRVPIDLGRYSDASGVITVLNGGDTTDPYFAMQALLLAHDHGLDIAQPAAKFASWLVAHQKPDGTFDRFCKSAAKTWVPCKTADADDALLALWMRLLDTMPLALNKNEAWRKSYAVSQKALDHLYQPSRGVYMVSPVYLHGLFMDNLEVWSLKSTSRTSRPGEAEKLARGIYSTFWQPANRQFMVSTQLEQRSQSPQFYPDHVAQIFPLMVNFPLLPQTAKGHYQGWMALHRAEWLRQGINDYPWGLLAVLALTQGDTHSAGCWLRETASMRHSARWAVTDEAARQILDSRQIPPAGKAAACG